MVIVNKGIEEMLLDIEFERMTSYVFESMSYFEDMPAHTNGRSYDGTPFSLTKQVIGPSGPYISKDDRCDIDDCIGFALENAWMHANNEQDFPEMSIKGFAGKKGIVIRIRDGGSGFDHAEIQRRYLAKERYCSNWGYGFKHFNETGAEVSFENRGTTVNIMWLRRP